MVCMKAATNSEFMTNPPQQQINDVSEKSLFEAIVENCSDAVIVIDSALTITYANPATALIFEIGEKNLIGQPLNKLIPSRFHEGHDQLIDGFLSSEDMARYMRNRNRDITGVRADGEEFPVEVSILKGNGRSGPFMAAMLRDISEQKRLEDKLAKQAALDPLTGILNRRALQDRAEEECARSTRYGQSLTIAMLDIDRFKDVNDRYGHAIGDNSINHVVEIISQEMRTTDILGRWGGEEFIIILPSTGEHAALTFAQRLRRKIEGTPLTFDTKKGSQLTMTVSIGVASFRPDCEKFDALVERADQALYSAKRSGRNRVATIALEHGRKANAIGS
jgi:two-component system, cell cycle response regulator